MPHAEADTQYVAGTCSLLPIFSDCSAFYTFRFYLHNSAEYGALQLTCAVKKNLILQAYSPIRSITGSINLKYIVQLNNVQKKSGLHAANRVTDKHVNFANQKMKVCLHDDLCIEGRNRNRL